MQYRKKPVVIEAFRLGFEKIPAWAEHLKFGHIHGVVDCLIDTLEGSMIASHGDWIIRGVKGELYPCKADIFSATYDFVDNRSERAAKEVSQRFHGENDLRDSDKQNQIQGSPTK